ncbi:MAG: hypothetical protein IT303_18470 [Dehalococcoidia bacterium]|nr:hypothetical protein [Dehalococcoidia bacterium]
MAGSEGPWDMHDEAALGLVIWTTDIAGLAGFLQAVGGLEILERHPGFAEMRAGTARISLHDDDADRRHPWYRALAQEGVARGIGAEIRLRVPDVDAAYATGLRMGGLSIATPSELGGTRECQVMGPDGYVLTLWQTSDAEPGPPPPPARPATTWPTRPSTLHRR